MLLAKLLRDCRTGASTAHVPTHVSNVESFLRKHATDSSNAWMSLAGAGFHITVDLHGSGPAFVEMHGPYPVGSELDMAQFSGVAHHCGSIEATALSDAIHLMARGDSPFDRISASSEQFRQYNGHDE